MKSMIFFLFCILEGLVSAAQGSWRINTPTFETASHPQLKIHTIQKTSEFTIFELSYTTVIQDSTYLEICNTFHLISSGSQVATFVKASGAPIADMSGGNAFECEPKAIGRFVPAETVAHFKIYFSALPDGIEKVDLVEFNGREVCEFVIRGIRLPFSTGLNPEVEEIPKMPPDIILPTGENRPVEVNNETVVHQSFVDIEIWDNDQVDNDIISLSLNDAWILKGYELLKPKKFLRLQLRPGVNWLMMRAENLGRIPPNTAAIAIIEGAQRKIFTLNADMGKSEVLKLMRQ